jgi:hypothetical protein
MLIRVNIPYLDGDTSTASDFHTDATDLVLQRHALGELLTNGRQQQLLPNNLLRKPRGTERGRKGGREREKLLTTIVENVLVMK